MALIGDDLIRKYLSMQNSFSNQFCSVYIPFFEGNRQSETEHESV